MIGNDILGALGAIWDSRNRTRTVRIGERGSNNEGVTDEQLGQFYAHLRGNSGGGAGGDGGVNTSAAWGAMRLRTAVRRRRWSLVGRRRRQYRQQPHRWRRRRTLCSDRRARARLGSFHARNHGSARDAGTYFTLTQAPEPCGCAPSSSAWTG